MPEPKYALVHEWLTPLATGGSELVVREILEQIDADLYALIDFESTNPESYLYQRKIGTTFLQQFPLARRGVQNYLPLLPLAIEQLDLRDYDIILSSSHAVAKGVLTRPGQFHLCYCHTPMRYAWDLTFDYLNRSALGRGLPGIASRYILHKLRLWDVISANRVDRFVANSNYTARRIWRCYRRQADVIYPPIHCDRFPFRADKEEFYLTVSRLVSYKQVSLIVRAFNQLGRNLVVIGTGPDLEALQEMAKPNITFLGFQPNEVVADYMSRAKAFVYAACEDFGMAVVEAQACGTPAIAYGKGGALETVRDRVTGLLFPEQTPESLVEITNRFETLQFNPERIYAHAREFDTKVFQERYQQLLERSYAAFGQSSTSSFPDLY
ncbi:glycosyltransferase [Roseofilum sp. BLCC_M143]|uniref:Glycosyltransferase n=1 Tax=Roseofilum casamattae BLCC-M143 TaxID=3022442 RepID=A0ABT7BXL6_9CYAN|nr:glycosyltransferase [Roseofilum casamattae]MDJ1183930.1 glycosyltransferase [Roseofilum casamattae BLCC-M143]